MLFWIWHVPILKGKGEIVKEAFVDTRKRLERTANNANIVEEKQRVEFVYKINRL